jgi:hypothetical protein
MKTEVQQFMIGKVSIANIQSLKLHEVPEIVYRCEDCRRIFCGFFFQRELEVLRSETSRITRKPFITSAALICSYLRIYLIFSGLFNERQ